MSCKDRLLREVICANLPASILRRGQSTWSVDVARKTTDKKYANLTDYSCIYKDRWHCKELNIFPIQKYNRIHKLMTKNGGYVTDIGNINIY